MATMTKTTRTGSLFRSNPVLNRLNKIDNYSLESDKATYSGITRKTAFFLVVTLIGILLYLVADAYFLSSQEKIIRANYRGFEFYMSAAQVIIFAASAIIAIIFQLIAAFVPKSIPVTGTVYSLSQGVLLSAIIFTILGDKSYLGLIALAVTVIVVLTMSILYRTGVIKVTAKFRMVLMSLAFSFIGVALLMLILNLIPFTRGFVSSIMGNFWVSIGFTLISIVIACLFLISDFDTIDRVVANEYDKKYEWMAAFGLAFTILWIYFKILDLIIQIAGRSGSK